MIKLDIFSDPICPWCYIGKTRLFQALEAEDEHPFTIEWHPFQLNPDMPSGGMDRRAYLEGKFGGKEAAIRAYAPIAQTAEEMGLPLHLDKITRTPNTLNAHRLLHWAGLEGTQSTMMDVLCKAYFVEGKDIGDTQILTTLSKAGGLDPAITAKLLASDADTDDIRTRDAHARERGVSAVPTFIVAGQHVVPGAQPAELWSSVIKDIKDQLSAQG